MQPKYKTLAVAVALAALSTSSFADESDAFCNLTQAQAEVQKQLLGSAQMFATTGNPATGNSSTVTVGFSKSLSKQLQAKTTGELADATCDSYRADRKLAEQAQNVEQRGNLHAFEAMEPLLRQALDTASANVATEEAKLRAHTATLADVKAAYDARDVVRSLLTALQQTRSRIANQLPEAEVPLGGLVHDAITAHAAVASETAHLAAQSAWDVSIAAGAQTDPRNGGTTKPFVGLTVTYSFGAGAANRAANTVAGLSEKYENEQRDGPLQQYIRAKETAHGLIQAEEGVLQGLYERKTLADNTVDRLKGIQTDDAQRALRQANLEQLGVQAQIAGSEARLDYLRLWIARNADPRG
jgi:hypothetical protein